jgi:hypothetical protein
MTVTAILITHLFRALPKPRKVVKQWQSKITRLKQQLFRI